MGRYDNIEVGQLVTEKEIERENKHIYNDSLVIAKTPLVNGEGEPLFKVINPFDFALGAIRTIGDDHHAGHQGVLDYSSVVLEIPAGATWYTYAITPPDGRIHMKRRGVTLSSANGANQPARIRTRLYVDGTATGGTVIPVRNTNDSLPPYSNFQNFNLEGTVPTELGEDVQRGTCITVEVGAQTRSVESIENILKADTIYILEIENRSSNVAVRVQIDWLFYKTIIGGE